ncbi:MAG: hypothetical protein QOD26_3121 [Betaproteobacteria bacterium]|jgi:hypothetical protein|nr:hypothetical protein [Betaproteobacteria bacterium]
MRLFTMTMIVGLAALASGCSSVEWKQVSLQPLRNGQGHVIGQKETLCDCLNGERIARVALFEPRFDDHGVLVGYEEKIRGGVQLRDLNGRRIGTRFADHRSRANNPNSKGLTIIVHSAPAERAATASATTMDELVNLAGLSPYLN